jgi:hypothetical protein
MKIPEGFSHFEKEKVLIIAANFQEAKLFIGEDGELVSVGSFANKTPKFSDKEAFYQRGDGNRIYGSGASLEKPEKKIDQEFDFEFKKIIAALPEKKFDRIFLLAPTFARDNLLSLLPAGWKTPVIIDGNFLNFRPLEIIGLIDRSR